MPTDDARVDVVDVAPEQPEDIPLRERLLDAAIRILGDEGGPGLTVREVARAADCSTMGVYTHFEGKSGLLDAIVSEGYADLDQTVARAADHAAGGRERLMLAARAYRVWALDHPIQYQVMFTAYVPGYQRSGVALACDQGVFLRHDARVEHAIETGEIVGTVDDVHMIAAHLWATIHGHTMAAISRGLGADDPELSAWFEASVSWAISGVGARP